MNLVERVKAILLAEERMAGDRTRAGRRGLSLYQLCRDPCRIRRSAASSAPCCLYGRDSSRPDLCGESTICYLRDRLRVALIVDALRRPSTARRILAMRSSSRVYSYTPGLGRRHLLLVPRLAFLTILGLYGLYLLWLGLPVLMRCPDDKAIIYAIAV